MAAAARAGVADLSLPRRSCGVTAPSAGRSMTPGGRPRLARCGACGGGDVGEAAEEGVQGGPAVVDCGAFLVGERDGGEHALQLREARFLRDGHVSVQRAVIQLVGLCEPPGQIDVESRFGYLIRWWQAGSTRLVGGNSGDQGGPWLAGRAADDTWPDADPQAARTAVPGTRRALTSRISIFRARPMITTSVGNLGRAVS